MKIEIIKGHEQPISRMITTQNGPKTIHEQTAYAYTGGAFPVEFKIPLDSHGDAYPVGEYSLHPGSFTVNRFGSLEINRFQIRLVAEKPQSSVKSA